MDAKTYVKNVLITEARDFAPVQARLMEVRNIRLLHASAGISSEIAEIVQLTENAYGSDLPMVIDRVNLFEECGDILWYIAIACDTLDCTKEVAIGSRMMAHYLDDDVILARELSYSIPRLTHHAGVFADLTVKKLIFYGKPFDSKPLVELLTKIHAEVVLILDRAGSLPEDVRERNIAKLKARYGSKFTEAAALDRDLDKERAILESK